MNFNMQDTESIGTLFSIGKLSSRKSPSTETEKIDVSRVSYSSEVGNLMCATTCVQPDIARAMGVVSKYVAEKEKDRLTKPIEKFNSLRLMVT